MFRGRGVERKQSGAKGPAEMRGLYLHHSQKPKRMRSEANRFIFRADGGNEQCLPFLFCCRVLNLNPKVSVAPPFPTHSNGLRLPCRVYQTWHKHQEDKF